MTSTRLLSIAVVTLSAVLVGCGASASRADSTRAPSALADSASVSQASDPVSPSSPRDTNAAAPSLRARGNEPGWSLEIGPREMTLLADYGEQRLTTATPPAARSGDTTRYRTRVQERALAVTIVDRLCHDGMSGIAYPRIVTVRLDERELHGCGGEAEEALQGAEWVVDSIGGSPAAGETRPTIAFGPLGRVSGHATCNRFSGRYALHGEEIALSQLVSTEMACLAPEANAQETRFLRLLDAVRRYEHPAADRLVLRTEDGRTITARR